MKRRQIIIVAILVVLAVAGWVGWRLVRNTGPKDALTLYGNVDLRQVELAFNDSDRIDAVLAQEGDRLRPGQVVARLDVRRLQPQMAVVAAQTEAQSAVVERLHAGNRPEEIAEARASVAAAQADAVNAAAHFARTRSLFGAADGQAVVSQQDVENAQAAADAAAAKLSLQQKALDLEVAGPRREDIAQAEAQLRASQAQLAVLNRELADAALVSPVAGVVRARQMEAGEMASPQRPVYTIAVTDPNWVRAYVGEADLVRLKAGAPAAVAVDGFPHRTFQGWVGFISSVAEFTPKTVQTTDLRTSLVYEVRIFVKDPGDDLRLGMPATVSLRLAPASAPGTPGPGR